MVLWVTLRALNRTRAREDELRSSSPQSGGVLKRMRRIGSILIS
jgi:hypothetical protein